MFMKNQEKPPMRGANNNIDKEIENVTEPIKVTSVKRSMIFQPLLWYAFWFLLITCVYWPGLIVFPKRDHYVFMLGRLLFDSDMEWFLKTLNYARTRLLFPGDSFAFRPLHMFILGLEDILFRYNLLAQGIISSAIFSATATVLFYLSKKISNSIFLAVGVTSLWAFQLAGSEMLLWQHITPYILLPGFFCAALLLMSDQSVGRTKLFIAGILVFLAGVTHEIGGLIALSLAFFTFLSGDVSRKKYVWTFALGGIGALSLSAFDYFIINQIKTFAGTADIVNNTSFSSLSSSLLPFTGAVGIASFLPSSVHVFYLENWFIGWNFINVSKSVMVFGAISVVGIIVFTAIQTLLSLRKTGITSLYIASIFALSLFGLSFGVSAFRIITRSVDYMMIAPYYFSLLSLSISIMILVIIVRLNLKYLTATMSVILCILSVWHINRLYSELNVTRDEKIISYNILKTSREKIQNDKSICFGGMDLNSVPGNYIMWNPLYQDISCSERIGAVPVYLSSYKGAPALSFFQYIEGPSTSTDLQLHMNFLTLNQQIGNVSDFVTTSVKFGYSFEITLDNTNSPVFLMTTQTGEQFGFSLNYNLVNTIYNSQNMLVNTILWNPGVSETTYKVLFFHNQIVLSANGFFIGVLHRIRQEDGAPMKLEIFSSTKDTVKITKAITSTILNKSNFVFNPKYVF